MLGKADRAPLCTQLHKTRTTTENMSTTMKYSIQSPRYTQMPQVSCMKKRGRALSFDEGQGTCDDDSDLRAAKRAKVHFDTRCDDSIKTRVKYIDIFRSELDKPNMWWSRQERQAITDECHDEIDEYRHSCMDEVRHFLGVFEQCQESPSKASSDFLERTAHR